MILFTKKLVAVFLIAVTLLSGRADFSHAQQADVENFYRTKDYRTLKYKLPPKLDDSPGSQNSGVNINSRLDSSSNISSSGCPQEVLLGSVSTQRPIFGDVNINVVVDSPVTVQCSRF
ncbi:MAG: hypothetical protein ACOYK8_03570 [Alphaproteobacteria bacterium]